MTTNKTYHIYVGFDEREPEAFQVAEYTLYKYNKDKNIKVHKLNHRDLRKKGLFWRTWLINHDGSYQDVYDGRPFSTQFAHSRFLVPELWRQNEDPTKSDLVMFVDCDFVWTDDIQKMFTEIESLRDSSEHPYALYCTKHDYKPTNTVKMDGCTQVQYNKKLWSAMMVFDMSNPKNAVVDAPLVNHLAGNLLHSFSWLDDEDIGSIDGAWHWIYNYSPIVVGCPPKAIHYTEGGPWFPEYNNCWGAITWNTEYYNYLVSKVNCEGPYV